MDEFSLIQYQLKETPNQLQIKMIKLLDNATANGSGFELVSPLKEESTLLLSGVWNGATVALELSIDGTDWVTPTDGTFTADTASTLLLGQGLHVRMTVSAAGASTDLSAALF